MEKEIGRRKQERERKKLEKKECFWSLFGHGKKS
jgi:hypothetical protein